MSTRLAMLWLVRRLNPFRFENLLRLRSNPTDSVARLWLTCWRASHLYEQGETSRLDQTLAEAREIVARVPVDSGARVKFLLDALEANSAWAERDFETAERLYRSAIKSAADLLREAQNPVAHPEKQRDCEYYSNVLALLHANLATAVAARSPESPEAETHYQRAVEHAKREPRVCYAFVCENLARHYMQNKRWEDARAAFQLAATAMSELERGTRHRRNLADVATAEAVALLAKGELDESIMALRDNSGGLEQDISKLRMKSSNSGQEQEFNQRELTRFQSWFANSQYHLARALRQQELKDEALRAYESSAEAYRAADDWRSASVIAEHQGDLHVEAERVEAAADAYARGASNAERAKDSRRKVRLLAKCGAQLLAAGKRERGLQALGQCRQYWISSGSWDVYSSLVEDALPAFRRARVGAALRSYLDGLLREVVTDRERRDVVEGLRTLFKSAAADITTDHESAFRKDGVPLLNVVVPLAIDVDGPTLDALGGPDEVIKKFAPELRDRILKEFGVKVPGIRLRANETELPRGTYVIEILEVPHVTGNIDEDARFSPAPLERLKDAGIEPAWTNDSPAVPEGSWVRRADWTRAERAGLVLWDPLEYPVRHLEKVLAANLVEFVGHQEVQNLLETHEILKPGASHAIVAKESCAHMDALSNVVRCLVSERVSICGFPDIYEAFERMWKAGASAGAIVDEIRMLPALRPLLWGNSERYVHFRLGEQIEESLKSNMGGPSGKVLALEGAEEQQVLSAIRDATAGTGLPALVVASQKHRGLVRKLVEFDFPEMPVLASREVLPALLRRATREVSRFAAPASWKRGTE